MKYLYAILLPLAFGTWGLIFLPFSEGMMDYILIGIGVLVFIGGLLAEQSGQSKMNVINQLHLLKQQQVLEQIQTQLTTGSYEKLQKQETLIDLINALNTESKNLKKEIEQFSIDFQKQQTKKSIQQKDAYESLEKVLGDTHQESLQKMNDFIKEYTSRLIPSIDNLLKPLTKIEDAIRDNDENTGRKLNGIITSLEDGQDLNQGLIDQLENYSQSVQHIEKNLTEYSQKQIRDLVLITEKLQGNVMELASSKHNERQQAMKIQEKLIEQYAKLK